MADKEEDNKKVIEAIKERTPQDKIKLVGLYHLLVKINEAEDNLDKFETTTEYEAHLKEKALFQSALEVYRGQKGFSKDHTPNLSEFFTEEEMKSPEFAEIPPATIPEGLFLKLMESNPHLDETMTDKDKEILQHLQNIEVTKFPNKKDFTVEFTFAKNDFFTPETIRLEVICDGDNEGMSNIAKVVSPIKINWTAGKDPRHKEKKIPAKGKKKAKVVNEKLDSFFWIFEGCERVDEDEDMDEEDDTEVFTPMYFYSFACDILEGFEREFYQFVIPEMFGIKHTHPEDLEDENETGPGAIKAKQTNPECKQQ